jgi:hypothetical protein
VAAQSKSSSAEKDKNSMMKVQLQCSVILAVDIHAISDTALMSMVFSSKLT